MDIEKTKLFQGGRDQWWQGLKIDARREKLKFDYVNSGKTHNNISFWAVYYSSQIILKVPKFLCTVSLSCRHCEILIF